MRYLVRISCAVLFATIVESWQRVMCYCYIPAKGNMTILIYKNINFFFVDYAIVP